MAINHLKYILLTIGCFITFSSCKDDGYSLDKTYIAMATVVANDDNSFYLVLDDGAKLWNVSTYPYKVKNNQRVITSFAILSGQTGEFDHYIKINAIREVLTKNIIKLTPENEDLLGNDPIKILRYWIGDNYLNIGFGFNRGGKEAHSINMVENTAETDDSDGPIRLEFRHNANGDPALNGVTDYVAFNLRPYITEGKDGVDFVIKVNDFSGEKEYKLKFKYGKNTDESPSLTIEDTSTDATLYK